MLDKEIDKEEDEKEDESDGLFEDVPFTACI